MDQFFKPRTGLLVGLGIAALVLVTLGATMPDLATSASAPRPTARTAPDGYFVVNEARTPASYQVRLGPGGLVLGEGTLPPGEHAMLPTTAEHALLWARSRWDDGTATATCIATEGSGVVLRLRENPFRVECERLVPG